MSSQFEGKIKPLHNWTPLIESPFLNKITKRNIFLKMECHQPVGSFKIRGIGRLCQFYQYQGKNHFVSSSGGNAGIAVAFAGKKLDCSVTVFLPETSHKIFIDTLQHYDAKIKIVGTVWDEAHEAAMQYAQEINGAYIPPFDHPLIWAGHSTLIDEIVGTGIRPDAVVAAVGGGGLACGIIEGMQRYGWNIPFFGVETEGTASFAASFNAKQLVTLPEIKSIATSLGAKRVTQKLIDWSKIYPMHSIIVTDHAALQACHSFLNDHKILVEPSSGAALAAVYQIDEQLAQYKNIIVIVCGGVGLSLELLNNYLAKQ